MNIKINKNHSLFSGFNLVELMVCIAIAGILIAIGIPSYQRHLKREEFRKIINIVKPYKLAISDCIVKNHGDVSLCDSGWGSIPDDIKNTRVIKSLVVQDGQIAVIPTQRNDLTNKDNYIATAHWDPVAKNIIWQISGGAIADGLGKLG